MHFGQILIALGKLLEQVPQGCSAKFHICWWEHKLCCLHRNHTKKKHTIFRNVTDQDASEGFNSQQWNNLAWKVNRFYKGIGL